MNNNAAMEFFKTASRIHRYAHRKFAQDCAHKLSPLEGMIVFRLKENKRVKVSDISEYLGIAGSTLTGILDRMEARELIVRSRSKEDRRVVWVEMGPYMPEMFRAFEGILINFLNESALDIPDEWWERMAADMAYLEKKLKGQDSGENG